jgi:REP element-mobilizing transposase RayT
MDFLRKQLPHDPPHWLDPTQEAFFITINCLPRGVNQLARPKIWTHLVESIEFRENRGDWKWKIILAMPDHLHGIVVFPNAFFMRKCVAAWKRWLAKEQGIQWQRDFFDHRLRSGESAVEKANYIRNNPVRAGLVESPEEWQFVR